MASPSCKHFVSTDAVVWTESEPRGEVRLGFPSAHVQSHFTHERLRYHHVDAVDPSQIYSRDALQFAAKLESRGILGWFCLLSLGFLFCRLERNSIRETRQVLLQLLIALGDPLLVGVIHRYFLLQYKEQFRTPIALQAFGHLLMTGLNPRITEFSQLPRIMLPGHDRPHDRLPGQPTHIADYVRQLYVHLR